MRAPIGRITMTRSNPIQNRAIMRGIITGGLVFVIIISIGLWVTTTQRNQQLAQQQIALEEKARVLEAAAVDQMDAGHNAVAVKMLSEAIDLAPRRSEAYYHRAVAYANLGEFENALPDFEVAIKANPHWALPLAGRGSAYVALGNLEKAIADFDKAIHLEPGEAGLYTNRGQVYHQRGELELAMKDLNLAVQLDPDSVAPHFNRGVLFYALGKSDEAIEDFSQAITIDPMQAPAYFNRGMILAELGQTEAARTDLEKFIALGDSSEWTEIAEVILEELQHKGDQ